MAQPNPTSYDLNSLIIAVAALISGLIGWIYYVNASFKNKAQERKEFIETITDSRVQDKLKEFRAEMHQFMTSMEQKMENMNKMFFEALNNRK